MMRLSARLVGPAVIAAAAAAATGATSTSTAAATCRSPAGASVIHRSATAVVYRRRRAHSTANNWGCLRSTGHLTTLPGSRTSTNQRLLSSFRSAGRYLALVVEEIVGHDMRGTIGMSVFDLRSRRAVGGFALDFRTEDPDRRRMRSLILTATGTAAWRETGRVDRVAALDLHSKRRVLDSGAPGSLRELVLVRGTTAQWRSNGELRHRRIDQLGR